jgi:flagellar FliL protein
VKAVLPPIRSGILEKLSQFTAAELLSQDGKEKLKKEILREASVPFGGGEDDEEDTSAKKKKKKVVHVEYPVTGVLFSSFIVQ